MTPPNAIGRSQVFYNEQDGVCEAPEPVVQSDGPMCTIDSYSMAQRLRDLNANRFARSLNQHLLTRTASLDPSALAGLASSGSSASAAHINPASLNILSIPLSVAGCADDAELPPIDEMPDEPPTENPPPNTSGTDGVSSVTPDHASGECLNPADLLLSSIDNNMLMVCGDDPAVDGGPGAGRIELVNPAESSGDVPFITVPTQIDGDSSRTVRLSAGAVDPSSSRVFVGVSPSGTTTDFETMPSIYANSGIFTTAQTGDGSATFTQFDRLQFVSDLVQFPLVSINDGSVIGQSDALQPNSPVAMTVVGDTLYVLNNNLALMESNPDDPIAYAPASIHAYTIGADGSLTVKPIGDMQLQTDTEVSPGHAHILIGFNNAAAINSLPDGRLAVLIRGIGGGDNPSKILLIDPANPADTTQFPITDSASDGERPLNMWAGPSNQMPIVEYQGVQHAVIGAGDGTGRVVMVNLETGFGTYVGGFGDGHNITNVVVDQSGTQLLIVSDQGQVRNINLNEIDDATGLPIGGPNHTLPADPRLAAIRGNNMIVAHPTSYTQVVVSEPPTSGN